MLAYKKFFQYFFLLFLVGFTASCSRGEFDHAISNKGINLSFNNQFTFVSFNKDTQVLMGKNKDGKSLIKIHFYKAQSKSDALLKIKNQIKIKMMSYDFVAVPYPGQMTHSSNCDTSFLPKLQKSLGFNYLFYSASERLAPVVCQGEEISYHAGAAYYLTNDLHNVLMAEFYIGKQFGIMEINDFFRNNFKSMQIIEIDQL